MFVVTSDERRYFAIGSATGEFLDVDLSLVDPAEEDGRVLLIEAEHPELHEALEADADEVVVEGQAMNPRLHLALHQVVANQLWDNDPPETWETAQRLTELGYDRHDVLHMLSFAVGNQVFGILQGEDSDPDELLSALAGLPDSWEALREEPVRPRELPHMNRAERRQAQRHRRHH